MQASDSLQHIPELSRSIVLLLTTGVGICQLWCIHKPKMHLLK